MEVKLKKKIETKHILILDSSDSRKKNFHFFLRIVDKLTEYLFKNNLESGIIVEMFLNELWVYLYRNVENKLFDGQCKVMLKKIISEDRKSFIDVKI